MKKVISVLLAATLAFSATTLFTGCDSEKDYPLEVANLEIKKEPENIVVLSAETADIISYIGYDVKMVGRSDEVNQEFLSVVPSVGSAQVPNIEKIKESEADIVFADVDIDSTAVKALADEGIMVISMASPKNLAEIETAYVTLGKILGGQFAGTEKGASSFESFLSDMEMITDGINTGSVPKTVCYLYLDGDTLRTLNSGTCGDFILSYTGAINTAINITESKVDPRILKVANPEAIFYADDATLKYIKNDPDLAALSAVKSKRMYMITPTEMERMGTTAVNTVNKMVSYIYPESVKPTTPAATTATTATDTQKETTAATAPTETATSSSTATTPVSVAEEYNMELNGVTLKIEDENDNVKIMQTRLYDLGYVTDLENITGYYGELTKKAVKDFQKASSIKQTGVADAATIEAMFMSNAKKAA